MSDERLKRCSFDAEDLVWKDRTVIPASVRAIDPVVERLLSAVGAMGCGTGKEFEIETALREALANAIVHGCGRDEAKQIEVCVGCDEGRGVLIVVRDPGTGFDPREIPSPVIGQQVYAAHGRGIYLINELMDEVRFERDGTEIWMRKR